MKASWREYAAESMRNTEWYEKVWGRCESLMGKYVWFVLYRNLENSGFLYKT